MSRLAELGREGVLLLCGDSTNVDRAGFSPSEAQVGPHLEDVFSRCEGRIVVMHQVGHFKEEWDGDQRRSRSRRTRPSIAAKVEKLSDLSRKDQRGKRSDASSNGLLKIPTAPPSIARLRRRSFDRL